MLRYEGCSDFRQRVVASTLSGKPLRISEIRSDDESPGLQDFEASFLRLLDKISDGCHIEINETGTTLRYRPGLLVGGSVSHECCLSRSIGWYLEGIFPLAAFCKSALSLNLTGVTNDDMDLSVDTLSGVTLPLLRNFGIEGARITINRRGSAPKGGGSVSFFCPQIREINPIFVVDAGLIKRVRGVGYCSRISPTIITRVIESARAVLNNLLPDVFIHTDHFKGADGGLSPGYSLFLVAESTTGALLSVEHTASSNSNRAPTLPEDIGRDCALMLLEEIRRGGVVDSSHQSLALQMMVLGPEDVCKLRFGALTESAIQTLRILRDAFGVIFKLKEDPTDKTVLVSCLGIGYKNMARKVA